MGPDELGGEKVKRGSMVVIAPYVLHRHEMYWRGRICSIRTAFSAKFETLTEQAKELTSLGQRLASSNMEPLARNVGQTFRKAS